MNDKFLYWLYSFLHVLIFCGLLLAAVIIGYKSGYEDAAKKYKKELDWWTNEPTVRIMDMNFTITSDLDIWKEKHEGAKIIKLVEFEQKTNYGVYWLPEGTK